MADSTISTIPAATFNPLKKRKRTAGSSTSTKEPRPNPIECPVCLTARSPKLIHNISNCNCIYCVYCIREVFAVAQQNGHGNYWRPAMCCDQKLDFDLFEPYLTPQLRRSYKSKAEEEKVDQSLYCGNVKCREYILQENIKDEFGSCGKCKMKTCVKPECKKPRSDHLGIYVICPDDLETKELKALANKKGWKRCPKCCALTERTRGCSDIRCICRTEWCYACGKAVKGTKDACQCHPAPARPTPQTAPDEIQVQREVIVIHEGNDVGAFGTRNVDMTDVKPSIEDIEAQHRPTLYTDREVMAELIRRTDVPGPSSLPAERDVVAELESLAAPNGGMTRELVQRSAEPNDADTSGILSDPIPETARETIHESLEDLLQAFNSYEASLPDSLRDNPIADLEHELALPRNSTSGHLAAASSEVSHGSSSETNLATAEPDSLVADDQARRTKTSCAPAFNATETTITADVPATSATVNDESIGKRPEINSDCNFEQSMEISIPEPYTAEPMTVSPQSALTQDIIMQNDMPDWLMESIEEYLSPYGGDIELERRGDSETA